MLNEEWGKKEIYEFACNRAMRKILKLYTIFPFNEMFYTFTLRL